MIFKRLMLLFLIVCNALTAQKNEFSLKGETADLEDGTYLYLRDLVNGGDIDSALVSDNNFKFTTELPEPTLYVMLFTKDKKNFGELWLEESSMTFDATSGHFKDAKVTGSRNHSLFKKIHKELYSDPEMTDEEKLQWEQEFIKNNPGALVSAYLLHGNKRWTQEEVGDAYSRWSKQVRNSSLGQKISLYLEKIYRNSENLMPISVFLTLGMK